MRNAYKGNFQLVSLFLLVVFAGGAVISQAQTTFGTILGKVADSSASAVADASVTVREVNTGDVRKTKSTSAGEYQVTHLNPGRYEVLVEHTGFKRFVRESVALQTTAVVRVDATLEVGDLTTSVTVSADAAPIETETGRIGVIQSQTVYQYAPVAANRGAFNQFVLAPGTMVTAQSVYSINGTRGYSNGYSIDGTSTRTPTSGAQESAQSPWIDYLQESRIDSVNNSAEFAHAGTFNMTTKSGTNKLHGSAEYLYQGSPFLARSFFVAKKPFSLYHLWAGVLGGPIYIPKVYDGRNRTFFFIGYNGDTSPNSTILNPNVPTVAMRGGNFSALTNSNGSLLAIRDPTTGQPFANNTIPTNRLSQSALAFQNTFYPLPNTGGPNSLAANYQGPVKTNDAISTGFLGRFDHQFSNKNRAYIRYFHSMVNFKRNDGLLPAMGYFRRIRTQSSWTVADTHTFSPTVINEVRLGGYGKRWPINSGWLGKQLIDQAGLTGYPGTVPDNVNGVPGNTITGFTAITAQNTSLQRLLSLNLNNTVTWMRNAHTFKFGFDGLHGRDNNYPSSPSGTLGSFNFTGFASNYGYADFLLGIPRTSTWSGITPAYNSRNYEFGFFVQDDWKVTSRLTLNLGVRWEYHGPFRDRDNRIYNFDPATGSIVIPSEESRSSIVRNYPANINIVTADRAGFPGTRLINATTKDIAPRFGFAYRIGPGAKTVLRGGYGWYYDSLVPKVFNGLSSGPYVGSLTFDNTISNGVPLYQWPLAFPGGTGAPLGAQTINAVNPSLGDSYTQQINVTLERAVWMQTGVRVSYIGMLSRHLPYRRNLNQPPASTTPFTASRRLYPQFNTITYTESGASQAYHALQIEATRRYSNGLAFNAHYTWAKNLTDSLDNNQLGAVIQDAYNRRAERGNEVYTPRQRAEANFVYDIPVGKGRQHLASLPWYVDRVIGGWTLAGLYFARTGYWVTPSFQGSDPSNTGQTTGRPDCTGNPNLPSGQRTLQKWFNTAAFATPPSGRFGNCGVNIIETPGANVFSLGVNKWFPIKEHFRLRFQVNMRNLFNHPTLFGNPATNISAPGQVAQITGYQIALEDNAFRQIYGGLRLEW